MLALATATLGACTSDTTPAPSPTASGPEPTVARATATEPVAATPVPTTENARFGVWLIDVTQTRVHRVYEGETGALAAFGRDDTSVWVAVPSDGTREAESFRFSLDGVEQERLAGLHLDTPEPTRCRQVMQSPPVAQIDGAEYPVSCGLFSPDKTKMLYETPGSAPGAPSTAYVLDFDTGERTLVTGNLRDCGGCDGRAGPAWSQGSRFVLVPELLDRGRVYLHDTATGTTRVVAEGEAGGRSVVEAGVTPSWSPTEEALTVPGTDGGAVIERPATGERVSLADATWPVRFSADGHVVYARAVSSGNATVTTVYDASTGELMARWDGASNENPYVERLRVVSTPTGPAGLLEQVSGCEGDMLYHPALREERCLNGVSAVFSRDGTRIAFLRRSDVGWNVRVMDPASGIDRKVANGVPDSRGITGNDPLLTWNEDGTRVLVEWPGYRGF